MTRTVALLIGFSIVLLLSELDASAQSVIIVYTDRGWYSDTGVHDPSNTTYFVGDFNNPAGSHEYRNFFVFNLSSVTKPIASATLTLLNPRYYSENPSENYELHDVVTSTPNLIAGTGGVAAYDDLGSGVVYGDGLITAADNGTVVSFPLNSFAINAMNNATGPFAMGGSITTLSHQPNDEYAFGYSDLLSVDFGGALQLTLVPEPSTATLLAVVLSVFAHLRRPTSHNRA